MKRKYPLKLRLLWFIMSIGIRTNYISSKAHEIYNNLPIIDCDMIDTYLCIYYWRKYKKECRYIKTHKVICLKEKKENE